MRHASRTAATLAAVAAALLASCADGALALDNPGGTAAPVAAVPTRGTGGAVYAAVAPKPRVVKPKPRTAKPKPRATKPKPVKSTPRATKPKPRTVKKPVKPKPAHKPPAPSPAPVPSGAPSPAQTLVQGAVFPVRGPHSFGGPENRFGAERAGHIHEGQDVLAAEGLSVVAPLPGTIVTTGYQAAGAGWYVAEQAADGLSFFYAHCQAGSLAVQAEQSVRAGQQLCRVGQTGDATGPHLHLEVWVGGWHVGRGYPIDPLPYLEAWDR